MLPLERVKQLAHPLHVFGRRRVFQQVGPALDDQAAIFTRRRAAPQRKSAFDKVCGGGIKLRLASGDLGTDIDGRFVQRPALHPCGKVISSLDQHRLRQACRNLDQTVLDLSALIDQDAQGFTGRQRYELDVANGDILGRRRDQTGPAGDRVVRVVQNWYEEFRDREED